LRHGRIVSALSAIIVALSVSGAPLQADAATGSGYHQSLAKAQTRLLTAFDTGTGGSPARCGQGQPLDGIRHAFLLPVLGSAATDSLTFRCRTTARKIVIDAGGFTVSEDSAGPSYPLPFPAGDLVRFDRPHLNAICDDVVENLLPAIGRGPVRVTLDGKLQKAVPVATRWFIARLSTSRTEYPSTIELGHPGRLATGFCGHKVIVRHLQPGRHAVTVNYSKWADGDEKVVFTYKIKVLRHRH
jgi:hypothetical protein